MMFQAMILDCKAILGRGQPGRMTWILLWIMPLAQDRSLDLLISSPTRYHCTMDTPTLFYEYWSQMNNTDLNLTPHRGSCYDMVIGHKSHYPRSSIFPVILLKAGSWRWLRLTRIRVRRDSRGSRIMNGHIVAVIMNSGIVIYCLLWYSFNIICIWYISFLLNWDNSIFILFIHLFTYSLNSFIRSIRFRLLHRGSGVRIPGAPTSGDCWESTPGYSFTKAFRR